MAFSIFIVGCQSGGDGSGANQGPESKYSGLWIEKGAALELRKTGALKSFCNDIVKGFELQLVPARHISRSGDVYLYDPSVGAKPEFKIGSVDEEGNFKLSGLYKMQSPGSKGLVELSEDKQSLVLILTQSTTKSSEHYVRATKQEIEDYFKAQQACR